MLSPSINDVEGLVNLDLSQPCLVFGQKTQLSTEMGPLSRLFSAFINLCFF